MQANQWRLVEFGILLFESPAPFDHSKLFLVDNTWTLIGSSNWDARSLELNFEVNVECYDTAFNASVGALVDAKRDTAFAIVSVPERPLLIRLRNNFCRLFSPYL
jgi:cardiolipin synthase